MDKKAFVTHPVSMFLVAVIIGMVLAILWADGYAQTYLHISYNPFI